MSSLLSIRSRLSRSADSGDLFSLGLLSSRSPSPNFEFLLPSVVREDGREERGISPECPGPSMAKTFLPEFGAISICIGSKNTLAPNWDPPADDLGVRYSWYGGGGPSSCRGGVLVPLDSASEPSPSPPLVDLPGFWLEIVQLKVQLNRIFVFHVIWRVHPEEFLQLTCQLEISLGYHVADCHNHSYCFRLITQWETFRCCHVSVPLRLRTEGPFARRIVGFLPNFFDQNSEAPGTLPKRVWAQDPANPYLAPQNLGKTEPSCKILQNQGGLVPRG